MKHLAQAVAKRKAAAKQDAEPPKVAIVVSAAGAAARTVGLYKALMTLQENVRKTLDNSSDFQKVKALANTVAEEGMSRGLAAYANTGENAAGLFANFPACEELDAISWALDDRRNTTALEGIQAVAGLEAEVGGADLLVTIDSLMAAINAFGDDLDYREDMGEKLSSSLDGVEISDEALSAVTVTAVSAESRKAQLAALTAVAGTMSSPLDFTGLTADGAKKMVEDLTTAIGMLADVTGLAIDEDGIVTVDTANISEDYSATAGNLLEKGYTAPALLDLAHQLVSLVEVFEEVCSNADAIEAGFKTAVATEDAPAADDAAGDDAEDDADEASTDDEAPAAEDAAAAATAEAEGEPAESEPAADEAGEDETAEDGAASSDEAPEVAGVTQVVNLVCGYATVIMAVIDSATIAMTSIIETGEIVEKIAGTDESSDDEASDDDDAEGDDAAANGAPAEDAPAEAGEPAMDAAASATAEAEGTTAVIEDGAAVAAATKEKPKHRRLI